MSKYITATTEIMGGQPVIKGTRIPVELVLERLEENVDTTLLFEDYPQLTPEDIKACLWYAKELVRGEEVYPLHIHRPGQHQAPHMKFLLDANVEYRLASFLTSLHHDVKTIVRDYPHALPDHEVLALAVQEKRVLLTNDRDFGELIFRQHHPHCGVILFRLKNTKEIAVKCRWLQTILTTHQTCLHDYLVITSRGVRVRKTTQQAAA